MKINLKDSKIINYEISVDIYGSARQYIGYSFGYTNGREGFTKDSLPIHIGKQLQMVTNLRDDERRVIAYEIAANILEHIEEDQL